MTHEKRPRKRQRPGEDEFDMVLNNAEEVTPSVVTQKLPPIPLESISQSERISILRFELGFYKFSNLEHFI